VVAAGHPVRALGLLHADRAGRAERVGLAVAVVSSRDPLASLNLLHIGYKLWSKSRATP
jgi:hypothetical protein